MATLRLEETKVSGKEVDGEMLPEKYTYDCIGSWTVGSKNVLIKVAIKTEEPLPITKTDLLELGVQ